MLSQANSLEITYAAFGLLGYLLVIYFAQKKPQLHIETINNAYSF